MSTIQLKKVTKRIGYMKKDMVLTSNVRYSTIKASDLISYASENSGISRANMAAAFYAIEQQLYQFLCNGHSLQLGSLGTFYISTNAHAVEVGEEKEAGAAAVYRLSVQFRQSKKLHDHLTSNVGLLTEKSGVQATDSNDNKDGGTTTPGTGGGMVEDQP